MGRLRVVQPVVRWRWDGRTASMQSIKDTAGAEAEAQRIGLIHEGVCGKQVICAGWLDAVQ